MSTLASATSPPNRRIDHYTVVLAVLTAAAAAWILLVLLHGDGHNGAPGPSTAPVHHGEHTAGVHGEHTGGTHIHSPAVSPEGAAPTPIAQQAVHAVGGWGLMVVAMMLPPALPLLHTVRRLVSNRQPAALLTLFSAGIFIAAWTVVGAVLATGYFVIRALTGEVWAGTDKAWVAGAVILLAGVYQFTPLKELCLRGCRSPRSFVLAHWQGRRTASAELLSLTGAYALSCIGCCWALMLICFAVGTAAIPVMVALTVVMAAERLVSWGRRLVRPTGLILIGLGLAMLAGPALTGLSNP